MKDFACLNFLRFTSYCFLRYSGYFASALVFFLKSYRGQPLSAGPAFAAFGAFIFLSLYVCLYFGEGLIALAELRSTLKRITETLLLEETSRSDLNILSSSGKVKKQPLGRPAFSRYAVILKEASLSWKDLAKEGVVEEAFSTRSTPSSVRKEVFRSSSLDDIKTFSLKSKWLYSKPKYSSVLSHISLKLKRGELLCVSGPVGCGKSTLLLAILRENYLMQGGQLDVDPSAEISYAEPSPFLLCDSIQNNILFGSPYESRRFEAVTKAACLDRDFAQLPMGHETTIVEGGSNLSGGQKARVTLARALYKRASLYLLDDPFSALDEAVAQRVMEKAVSGFLKGKTVLLATHRLSVLPKEQKIVWLEGEQIRFTGKVEDLNNSKIRELPLSEQLLLQEGRLSSPAEESFTVEDCFEVDEHSRLPLANLSQIMSPSNKTDYSCCDSDRKLNSPPSSRQGGESPRRLLYRRQTTSFNLISKETKDQKRRCSALFLEYMKFSGGWLSILAILLVSLLQAFGNLAVSECLKRWVAADESEDKATSHFPLTFFLVIGVFFLSSMVSTLSISGLFLLQAQRLHKAMISKLIRAPLSFFDESPVGRVVSRFAKDLGVADMLMPVTVVEFCEAFFRILSIMGVLCFSNPLMVGPLLVVLFLLVFLRSRLQLITSEAMKLEGLSRSPISSLLASSLEGNPVIRAHQKQDFFCAQLRAYLTDNANAIATFHLISRGFAFFVNIFNVLILAASLLFSFLFRNDSNVLQLVLAIQLTLDLVNWLQYSARLSSEIQNYQVSISRCLEYASLPPEPTALKIRPRRLSHATQTILSFPWKAPSSTDSWVTNGEIEFKNVTLRYRDELAPALFHFSLKIPGRSKVAIMGRTGAGKSSVLAALTQMYPIAKGGSVWIDGLDTSLVGVQSLRRSISFIPQTPFFFQGNIRENLDPLETASDEAIWQVLRQVELEESVRNSSEGLRTLLMDSSSLFSKGQQQLLCLARALLEKRKIVVLDEPSANMDKRTEDQVKRILKTRFQEKTLIMITHSLRNLEDMDEIVVMERGEIARRGPPSQVLPRLDSKRAWAL